MSLLDGFFAYYQQSVPSPRPLEEEYSSIRDPYTYAWDYLRETIWGPFSRSEVSRMVLDYAQATTASMDEAYATHRLIAIELADLYLARHGITRPEGSGP